MVKQTLHAIYTSQVYEYVSLKCCVQVGDVVVTGQTNDASVKEALLLWCQRMVEGYPNIQISDFNKSWTSGLAFLAILHRHR